MKKLIIPLLTFMLGGVVWTQCTLANKEIVLGFFGKAPQSIDWNEKAPHYMRIRMFLPRIYKEYPSLFEECFLDHAGTEPFTEKDSLGRIKKTIALAFFTGGLKGYLAAREFEAIVIMILSLGWIFVIIHKSKKVAEPAGSGYPPQGVGPPDP